MGLVVRKFLGIDNVQEAARILPRGEASFQTVAENIDLDDDGMPHRRDGYEIPVHPGTGIHSLWSNGDTCLFVQQGTLKQLNANFTSTTLRSSVGHGRMVYVDAAGTIHLTNNSFIGKLKDGVVSVFSDPDQTYKISMLAGHLIEWFNGRLYVARGKQVWYSDPMAPGRTDSRRGFLQLNSTVTLLRAVTDGLWAADLSATYFLAGGGPDKFQRIRKADYGAIPFSDRSIEAERVGNLDQQGTGARMILWASPEGLCVGGPNGLFKNLTQRHFRLRGQFQGAAHVRRVDEFYQYLVSLSGPTSASITAVPFSAATSMAATVAT